MSQYIGDQCVQQIPMLKTWYPLAKGAMNSDAMEQFLRHAFSTLKVSPEVRSSCGAVVLLLLWLGKHQVK
jgi:hypothetical protein